MNQLSIAWGSTYKILVPRDYLTDLGGDVYELDTQKFRRDLLLLEQSTLGIVEPPTHVHNTTYTISGVEYARAIIITPPYSVEFEDGQYTISLVGSNNNISDVANGILVRNQVQVLSNNSGGLVVSDVNTDGNNTCGTLVVGTGGNKLTVSNVNSVSQLLINDKLVVTSDMCNRTVHSNSKLTLNAS